jgi:erythromycin esterase-like protein
MSKVSSPVAKAIKTEKVNQLRKSSISLKELYQNEFQSIRNEIGDAQVVLIGESSHGTEEFYHYRPELTNSLIKHKGFRLVLAEADFPPFYAINKILNGKDKNPLSSAMEHLKERFPYWMWHNSVAYNFFESILEHNSSKDPKNKVLVLGMDIYSLFRSAHEVIQYLEKHDKELADLASQLYETLGTFKPDGHTYGEAVATGRLKSQELNVAKMLSEINKHEMELAQASDNGDEFYGASENARIVKSAEEYYRKTFMGGNVTWSVRDTAMLEAIKHALKYQSSRNQETPKVVVWAHNSHIGDSSYTQHAQENQVNLGQLAREHFGIKNTFIVGFSTDTGTVRAAKRWNSNDLVFDLAPSLSGSSGDVLAKVSLQRGGEKDFGLLFRSNTRELTLEETTSKGLMSEPRLQRYIGVIYAKNTERQSHYSTGKMGQQYDMMIHIDETTALKKFMPGKIGDKGKSGVIDYSKWDNMDVTEEEDETEEY